MNDLKKIILVAIVAGLVSGIVTALGFGLVGGNQPVQETIREIVGAAGTRFPNGLQTDYVSYPPEATSILGDITYNTTRKCVIASGSDTCELINYSSVDWIIRPRIWLTGVATNTTAIFFVSTSTIARAGSWWAGVGSSTLPHNPISLAISTTSAPFGNVFYGFGTTTASDSQLAGRYPGGLFVLRKGDRATCGVTIGVHKAGDRGFFENTTSTSFTYRGNCSYEILATSTPDTTPER